MSENITIPKELKFKVVIRQSGEPSARQQKAEEAFFARLLEMAAKIKAESQRGVQKARI